jgi:hypothetical protein
MQTKGQTKRGRPSKFSPEIAEKIWERLIDGKSLRAICAQPQMPAKATVFRWLARDGEFRRHYVDAREFCTDCLLEEMVSIADSAKSFNSLKRELGALSLALGRMTLKKYRG